MPDPLMTFNDLEGHSLVAGLAYENAVRRTFVRLAGLVGQDGLIPVLDLDL